MTKPICLGSAAPSSPGEQLCVRRFGSGVKIEIDLVLRSDVGADCTASRPPRTGPVSAAANGVKRLPALSHFTSGPVWVANSAVSD